VEQIAERMTQSILADMPLVSGEQVAVMVNGLGATPPEELYIIFRRVHTLLSSIGVQIHRTYIGEYATSMEMAGASLTIFRIDDEMTSLLNHPAQTPFFTQVPK
jgi:dihydroxyacetone kinase-like protein